MFFRFRQPVTQFLGNPNEMQKYVSYFTYLVYIPSGCLLEDWRYFPREIGFNTKVPCSGPVKTVFLSNIVANVFIL